MKKLFISAVLVLSLTVSSFAADVNKVNSKALRNFSYEFSNAENVNWTSTENYLKASFTLNKKNMDAFYDVEGNILGTSSKIDLTDLPTIAKRSFAKKYSGYTVTEAIRFDATDETAYFISAQDEARSLILKVSDKGMVSVFKSVKK